MKSELWLLSIPCRSCTSSVPSLPIHFPALSQYSTIHVPAISQYSPVRVPVLSYPVLFMSRSRPIQSYSCPGPVPSQFCSCPGPVLFHPAHVPAPSSPIYDPVPPHSVRVRVRCLAQVPIWAFGVATRVPSGPSGRDTVCRAVPSSDCSPETDSRLLSGSCHGSEWPGRHGNTAMNAIERRHREYFWRN